MAVWPGTPSPGGRGRRASSLLRCERVWGSRRSLGGRPEPRWPPAFALRGPMNVFRLAPRLRPRPGPRASPSGCTDTPGGPVSPPRRRSAQVPGPLDPQAIGPRRAAGSGPPGSEVSRPSDNPVAIGPAARPGPGPRTPSPTTGWEQCNGGIRGACNIGPNQSRALISLGEFGCLLMGVAVCAVSQRERVVILLPPPGGTRRTEGGRRRRRSNFREPSRAVSSHGPRTSRPCSRRAR
ncbi:hypothetical protein KKHFBJBL_02642 [Brevundimonas sp. NIBR11]|nr:hypothetical protein KKHFBJBL_02642 [Brevundimonas sp. NIBR11]